jgi:3-deoxy-7-phosphoheptulonate synthase
MLKITDDLRISSLIPLITPEELVAHLPLTEEASEVVTQARNEAKAIIKGDDQRLLVIVGPCSIHDTKAALEYAEHLKKAVKKYKNELLIIMRVYFEKPRTTIGWKGLINDPHLDNSFDINQGLHIARKLLLDLANQGIAPATEFLDTISPQYISDLIAWGAIGARTTESQIHRELASGLSMPIGFKNGTDGNIQIAIDAIGAAQNPHHFLGVTKDGSAAIISTKGNDACHVILRGANTGPNYDEKTITQTVGALANKHRHTQIMIDCSHGNSRKDHLQQPNVAQAIADQLTKGNMAISGVMIESHLEEGKQNLSDSLQYGKSITDACLSWQQTEPVLEVLAQAIKKRRDVNEGHTKKA